MKIAKKIMLAWLSLASMLMAWSAAQAAPAELPNSRIQQSRVAYEGTKILAFETNKARDIFGVLISEKETNSSSEKINLLVFDTNGGPLKSVPLFTSTGGADDQLILHSKAGLAIDENAEAYVAVAARSGQVKFARLALRGAAASPVVKAIPLGGGSLEITKMLISRRGELVLTGALDGKGFASALSKQGVVAWTRPIDDGVTVIFDMVETEAGFTLIGGVPANFAAYVLWLGRLGLGGEIREKNLRSEMGSGRFAKLSVDGSQIALTYENLRTEGGVERSKVFLDVLSNPNSLKIQRGAEIFDGELLAPAGLAGSAGNFKLAGIGSGGVLKINSLTSGMEVRPLFKTTVAAPDYRRFHALEMLASTESLLLASIESRADGRQQKLEFVLSKIVVK